MRNSTTRVYRGVPSGPITLWRASALVTCNLNWESQLTICQTMLEDICTQKKKVILGNSVQHLCDIRSLQRRICTTDHFGRCLKSFNFIISMAIATTLRGQRAQTSPFLV